MGEEVCIAVEQERAIQLIQEESDRINKETEARIAKIQGVGQPCTEVKPGVFKILK